MPYVSGLMKALGGFFLIGGVMMFFDRAMCVFRTCPNADITLM